jgi:ribosomal protein S18 acetylase RimI-like enzyme
VSTSRPLLRPGTPDDAVTIAALAVQVFLDTYATEGIRPDLAREAFSEYSAEAFATRLRESARSFILAEQATGVVGFVELLAVPQPAPAGAVVGAQLVRLYIQPRFQRAGNGQRLLQAAEVAALSLGLSAVWLTAWEGNSRARRFYEATGYQDVGATTYSFQGNAYSNRVFAKHLGGSASEA